uniref:MarR family winged helix-turn-helix transcriptional regulator n=1 Tax=unclassified Frankia TaxID=2632575 RepID=UPI002AD2C7C9
MIGEREPAVATVNAVPVNAVPVNAVPVNAAGAAGVGAAEPGGSTYVPAVLAGSVGYLLRLAHERARADAQALLAPGQHPREYAMLVAIDADGAYSSQQRLAERLDVNRTAMVKLVDRLEQAGLVERRRNPADRRSYVLVPTDAGRARLTAMRPGLEAAERLFTAGLTPPERERLHGLLLRILVGPGHPSGLPEALTGRSTFLVVHAHYRVHTIASRLLAPVGITPRHAGALAVITNDTPCSQQHVAHELGTSGAVMVEIVDHLEARGLVERRSCPTDRRRYELSPTATGRTVLSSSWELITEADAHLTAPLPRSEAAQLPALLHRL